MHLILLLPFLVYLASAAKVPQKETAKADSASTLNAAASTVSIAQDLKIDFTLSNYWNNSMFLAQKTVSIPFVPGANFTTATVNSTKTTPVIVGVEVKETREFQKMMGIGAGITDATAIILQNLKETHPDAYIELLNLAFNPSNEWRLKGGAAMNMVRVPVGASDFGFTEYTYADTYDGSEDLNLAQFNIEKSPKRWATLQDIQKIQPDSIIMATPWSQPGWMKGHEDGSLRGSSVLEKYESVFGDYMVKFVEELDKKKGLKVNRISLQNEPLYDAAAYPCTKMEGPQQARIGDLTRTKLDAAGYKDVGILAYDHNWDQSSYPVTVFDDAKKNSFVGAAWHCYGGDPTGQDAFNAAFPNKEVWFTECTRVTQSFEEPWINIKKDFATLIAGSICHGSMTLILWNLALVVTKEGYTRPSLPKTCRNCLAPFLVFENATTPLQHMDTNMYSKLDSGTIDTATPNTAASAMRRSLAEYDNATVLPIEDEFEKRTIKVPPGATPLPNEGYNAMQIKSTGSLKNVNPPEGKLNTGAENENQVIPPTRDTYYRTSDFTTLAHLGLSIQPDVKGGDYGIRVGVTTTEDNTESPRVVSQLFRRDMGNGSSRWSLIILQQNDDNGYNYGVFEDITIQIKFREVVAKVILPPGAFTLQWTAPNI